ncbi:MAG: DUF1028 domain-containing protein [Planctomycetales bacterium]|nr:DUF1028 domain-containing protein [Planctomycetales bacterium]
MRRPIHTYSIVARDSRTGEMGVAVQSHWFSVGPVCAFAMAGIGAVATQAFAEPLYGPRGLMAMRRGIAAARALRALVARDPERDVRQVAMVDRRGRVAAHTGRRCLEWAGHRVGRGFSVQANMMVGPRVVPAMARAYRTARGDLAERLLRSLEAAQAAGGDVRGQQSAALVLVAARETGSYLGDRIYDLRVEDHPRPLQELRRLLDLARAYRRMETGDEALARGDAHGMLREYGAAARALPGNPEIAFWNALALARNGGLARARPVFRRVFARDRNWRTLLERLPARGLVTRELVGRILAR